MWTNPNPTLPNFSRVCSASSFWSRMAFLKALVWTAMVAERFATTASTIQNGDTLRAEDLPLKMLGSSSAVLDGPHLEALTKAPENGDFYNDSSRTVATEKVPPKNVRLAIAVISVRPDRRKAIRDTWLNWSDDRVEVLFFTEAPGQDADDNAAALTEEIRTYGDVVVQNVERGMNFGLKILNSMQWISDHYNFDYYLRLDDDYFLCLRRLLDELDCLHAEDNSTLVPFYAGFRSCIQKRHISYIDESYILMSRVIVERIVSSTKLQCSGYGSFTVGAWVTLGGPGNPDGDVEHVLDYRLDRFGRWWRKKNKDDGNVCKQLLGIHRTYSENMYALWNSPKLSNGSRTDPTSCEAFLYVDDGKCPFVQRGVPSKEIEGDNGQPCSSFRVRDAHIHCGGEGCE